ncbi:MAG: protein jag [Firmicutes bacterium]|nr:protein jag [Bacillota bacterium]
MDMIEMSAKTVDEATRLALEKLGCGAEEAEITILEEGSRGFLGIGSKNALVRAVKKFNPERCAVEFLHEMFLAMGLIVKIETKLKEKQLLIDLYGDDMGILIGKRGQTLDSLQYLTTLVVNKNKGSYISVSIDTENYRKRRRDTLEALARNLARKVKQTRKNIVLEPMNPYERRIIHYALQNDRYVTTYSEGEDPYRNVVIALKDKERRASKNKEAQE